MKLHILRGLEYIYRHVPFASGGIEACTLEYDELRNDSIIPWAWSLSHSGVDKISTVL